MDLKLLKMIDDLESSQADEVKYSFTAVKDDKEYEFTMTLKRQVEFNNETVGR